jgi:hypothetical protein
MKVLVGYGERSNGSVFYIVSDDNYSAYRREEVVSGTGLNAWTMLVIPQPGRTHVNGEAGEARAEQAFEDRVRASIGPKNLLPRWESKELQVRTYVVLSSAYVNGMKRRGVPDAIVNHHIYAPKGIWLWVSEFQDMTKPPETGVIGEIAIDATSLQLDPSPVLGNVDGWAYIWDSGDEEPSVVNAVLGGAKYRSALPDRTEQPAPTDPSAYRPLGARAAID